MKYLLHNVSRRDIKKHGARFVCALVAALSLASQIIPVASALSPDQINVFQEGINYFNTQVCGDTPSGTSVTAGIGTPTGLQFPALDPNSMADAINTYIKQTNPNSELNNLGATIVASAKNANINPFLVVAIAQQESNLSDPSDFNVAHANNSFGRTASGNQPSYQGSHSWYKWDSVKDSVDYTAAENQKPDQSDEPQFLVDEYGTFIKDNDLAGLVKKYDPNPSEYQQYIPDVTSWIKKMADMTGSNQGSPTSTGTGTATGTGTGTTGTTGTDTGPTGGGGGGAAIDDTAAKQAAQKANNGGEQVGYALFDSSGDLLANYNDTFNNYGASITKSMLLVAYLKQVGSGNLSSQDKSELTNMIEVSDNDSANWVWGQLNDPSSQVNAVASSAGMKSFRLNSTGDVDYYLGQSQITARDFAKFFSHIDTMIPQQQRDFGLNLLSNIDRQVGLLQSGLPGTVYSKEGWKTEPGTSARSGSPNPFGDEGHPWVVNQAAQFSSGGTTYGLAVTVGGAPTQDAGESTIKDIGSAIADAVKNGGAGSQQQSDNLQCCPTGSTVSPDGSIPTSLTGSNNQTKAYNFFLQLGLSPQQAAGVVANLYNESTVNPLVEGPDPSASATFGIAEWTPSSKFTTDKKKNNVQGTDGDLLTQLTVLWYEMNGKSDYWTTSLLPGLEKITDPGDAAVYFRDNFERCDTSYSSCADRASVGQQMYQQLANGGGGGSPAGGAQDAGGGCSNPTVSPNCQTATGDAKILCEAKQFDTVSYSQSIMGGNHLGSNKTWLNQCTNIGPQCYLDCAGLVNIAVYEAFGYDLQENTYGEAADSQHWQQVSFDKLQPGDLLQPGQYGGDHVEIVDHVSGNTIFTFGAHTDGVPQPQQVGPTSYTKGAGDLYLHWVGPGAS